jgi:hypothetical protein
MSGKEITEGPLQLTIESAHVGKKADVNIFHDPVKGIVGIVGKNIDEVFTIFDEVVNVLTKELTLNLNTTVSYYEMIYVLFLSSTKPPWKVIRTYVGNNKLDSVGRILGGLTGVSTINFCPYEGIPTNKKWYSLSIEPAIKNPEQYWIKTIYREPEISEIKNHSKKLREEMIEIIKAIEKNE